MKNVLVLMHDDSGQEARYQAALDLCRALEGHLTCLDVTILPVMAGDYAMMGGEAVLLAAEEEREQANRARMEPRLQEEGLPYSWTDVTGELGPALKDAAGLVDVIVVNRQLDDVHYPDMLGLAGEVLVKSGTPVLAVPQDAKGFNAAGHAMVAWDGSRESDAALRAAVPLLKLAERVTILEIDDGSIRVPAIEAAEYLSRHDIRPVVCRRSARSGGAADVLLAEVESSGADYLVQGGFGHSRLVETLFGGVTRRMLTASPVPIFLAH